MNIDIVYVCNIYKYGFNESGYGVCDEIDIDESVVNCLIFDNEFRIIKTLKRDIVFVKEALVYYNLSQDCFIDFETKEKYHFGIPNLVNSEILFVDIKKVKMFGSELMNSNKKHFSKKKILKKYNEFKGDQNECK